MPRQYLLATVHRPYNTDSPERLRSLMEILVEIGELIVFPVHPRTRRRMAEFGLDHVLNLRCSKVRLIDPVGFLDMLMLEQHARLIMTDSGGIQKEAYFFGVPCVTLRPETEWIETVEAGWNILVGTDRDRIARAVKGSWPNGVPSLLFGDGHASEKLAQALASQ